MNPNGVHDRVICESADVALPVTPTITQQSHRNHYTQFKSYLRRNLIYIQRLVHATDQQLSDEVRTQALHTLSYAMAERDLWPLVRELLLALAPKMELGGHREDWLPYLTQGLKQSKVMGDLKTAAECHLQIGLLYRLVSNFGAAREELVASIALAQETGEARNQARALNELAWLDHLQEKYVSAEEHVKQAAILFEYDDPELAMCYRVQGMIEIGYKNWQKAEHLHRKALQIFQDRNDLRRAAWSLHNLAYALREQKRFSDAFDLYGQAAATLENIGDIYHHALVLFSTGLTYAACGDFTKSLEFYQQAENKFRKLNADLQLAKLYTDMGLLYLALQNFVSAELTFSRSADIFKKLGDKSWQLNALDGLALAYISQQKLDEAKFVLEEALHELINDRNIRNYDYLFHTLNHHLRDLLD